MQTISLPKLLKSHLAKLGTCFDPDELAYLALTGKIEHAVRDRLAFSMHKALSEAQSTLTVAREWNRVDLAVLDVAAPRMLLELKAMYSFDMFAPKAKAQYPGAIRSDLEKLRALESKLSAKPCDHFAAAILTHPHKLPTSFDKRVIKYSNGIRAFRPLSMKQFHSATATNFSEHADCKLRKLAEGNAFGVKVSVYWCLFGPYRNAA